MEKCKQQHQWKALSDGRKKYRSTLRMARCEVISSKVAECKANVKSLYNLINNITGGVTENALPECKDDKCLADTFADYFIEKIQKIWDALDNQPLYAPIDQEVPIQFTEEDIGKIISNM